MGKIINLHLQYFLGCIVDSKSVRELTHLLADTTKLMDKTGEHTVQGRRILWGQREMAPPNFDGISIFHFNYVFI